MMSMKEINYFFLGPFFYKKLQLRKWNVRFLMSELGFCVFKFFIRLDLKVSLFLPNLSRFMILRSFKGSTVVTIQTIIKFERL